MVSPQYFELISQATKECLTCISNKQLTIVLQNINSYEERSQLHKKSQCANDLRGDYAMCLFIIPQSRVKLFSGVAKLGKVSQFRIKFTQVSSDFLIVEFLVSES